MKKGMSLFVWWAVLALTLDDANGVRGYALTLRFDPRVLEYTCVENGALAAAWDAPFAYAGEDYVNIAACGVTQLEGGGALTLLCFRVRAAHADVAACLELEAPELNDGHIPVVSVETTTNGTND